MSKTDIEDDIEEGSGESEELVGRASDDAAEKEEAAEPASGKGTTPADSKETPVVADEAKDEPNWTSIREVAKVRGGFDPGTWNDDEQAAHEIVDGYRRYRELEPDYELYRRMQPQFQAWLAGQQAPTQQPAPASEQPKWYQPPEFNQAWLNDLELDPDTGGIRPKKGANISPDRLNKVTNYIQWRKEVQDRFMSDPQSAIADIVASQIDERSQKIAAAQMEEFRAQQEAQSFVDKHANWLFRLNEQGQKIVDPVTGKNVLSPEGQLFGQYFEQAERRGLKTMADMTDYALAMLERHLYRQHYQGQASNSAPAKPAAGKAAVKEALVKASRAPKRAASQANGSDPNKSGQNPKASLAQQLLADLKEAGIGADDID